MSLRRLRSVSWVISAAGALTALALWVMPTPLPAAIDPAVQPESSETPLVLPVPDAAHAEAIAVASIFSASRTPPRRRYTPPESDSASAMTVESNAMLPGMPADSLALAGEIPRLYGTMVDSAAGSWLALLHLNGSTGPRLYTVGDADGGYRVVSVAPRVVVVRGPQGRITLRLDPE
jgi:hypothetical protein